MNLLLLYDDDFITPNRVVLNDRRFEHLCIVKKIRTGDIIQVGLLNGKIGQAEVIRLEDHAVEFNVVTDTLPPDALDINLILALPRPKMLKRILQTVSAMGVKQLQLINSAKVDKSYWQTPWLAPENINQHLLLGLEQAIDTILPEVTLHKRFKPFVEDQLPGQIKSRTAIVAHPGVAQLCPRALPESITLAVGPEGGFNPYEIDMLEQTGFRACHLGARILRVENAIPVLLSRLK